MKKVSAMLLASCLILAACQVQDAGVNEAHTPDQEVVSQQPSLLMSNLADSASFNQVSAALKEHLALEDVDSVMGGVVDYNETIQNTTLLTGFQATTPPQYDVNRIDELWLADNPDFIGTNCRINTYSLFKGQIQVIQKTPTDTEMFFMDHEAISATNLMTEEERQVFDQLFSVVETEATKDVKVHAQKMTDHWSTMAFTGKASMLSVVFHDDLDGQKLFVGHVGVLVPDQDQFLFIEKISFQEPYQAIRFASKDEAYSYLLEKYAEDYGQETALPFIMENDKLVKSVEG